MVVTIYYESRYNWKKLEYSYMHEADIRRVIMLQTEMPLTDIH